MPLTTPDAAVLSMIANFARHPRDTPEIVNVLMRDYSRTQDTDFMAALRGTIADAEYLNEVMTACARWQSRIEIFFSRLETEVQRYQTEARLAGDFRQQNLIIAYAAHFMVSGEEISLGDNPTFLSRLADNMPPILYEHSVSAGSQASGLLEAGMERISTWRQHVRFMANAFLRAQASGTDWPALTDEMADWCAARVAVLAIPEFIDALEEFLPEPVFNALTATIDTRLQGELSMPAIYALNGDHFRVRGRNFLDFISAYREQRRIEMADTPDTLDNESLVTLQASPMLIMTPDGGLRVLDLPEFDSPPNRGYTVSGLQAAPGAEAPELYVGDLRLTPDNQLQVLANLRPERWITLRPHPRITHVYTPDKAEMNPGSDTPKGKAPRRRVQLHDE